MTATLEIFNSHRPRLFAIAYRMLGTRADAEDVLQDVYLRWHGIAEAELRSAEAWLVTVTTRLCIDRLRSVKAEREAYIGPWVPEPLLAADTPSPERTAELAGDISIAFLMVLERLAPEERAAFLLREVFDTDYDDIARMLGKNAAACRQIVHRAKARVQQVRPRFDVPRAAHMQLLEAFMAAASSGSREQLQALFATDVKLFADGGGKVPSARRVLHGAERLVRFYGAIARQYGALFNYRIGPVNGEPGLLRYCGDTLDSVTSFVTDGARIREIYTVRNPEKLRPGAGLH
jgi:RNA polymerase sigma-70 factor (ECF subfamily)